MPFTICRFKDSCFITCVWVLPILMMSLNSSLFAFKEDSKISKFGMSRLFISMATAICMAVGKVSFELWLLNTREN